MHNSTYATDSAQSKPSFRLFSGCLVHFSSLVRYVNVDSLVQFLFFPRRSNLIQLTPWEISNQQYQKHCLTINFFRGFSAWKDQVCDFSPSPRKTHEFLTRQKKLKAKKIGSFVTRKGPLPFTGDPHLSLCALFLSFYCSDILFIIMVIIRLKLNSLYWMFSKFRLISKIYQKHNYL